MLTRQSRPNTIRTIPVYTMATGTQCTFCFACFAVGSVMCVCLSIFYPLFVARHACVISFGGILKTIAAKSASHSSP